MLRLRASVLVSLAVGGFAACAPLTAQTALKDAYQGVFRIGVALGPALYTESDARGAAMVKEQFNTITPENVLKWERVHPKDGTYDFSGGDRYVAFGESNHMFIIGHCLVWHSQTPKWVFEDGQGHPATREQLLERMRDHIHTVVGHYKGRVNGWDVVNEALNDDGTLRQSPWLKIIGEDFIAKAFQFAHEADPAAQLYYNDYSLEGAAKRNGMVELVKKLKAQGAPIYGVGTQGHWQLDGPSAANISDTLDAIAGLGVKAMVTELDIDVLPSAWTHTADVGATAKAGPEQFARLNPYPKELPAEMQQRLAERYGEIFQVFVRHSKSVERVTFWGLTDASSWLNNFPVRGRTAYPLLFDRAGQPKPAFAAVIAAAKSR
jgi:endo-1,4-beta-xylanase